MFLQNIYLSKNKTIVELMIKFCLLPKNVLTFWCGVRALCRVPCLARLCGMCICMTYTSHRRIMLNICMKVTLSSCKVYLFFITNHQWCLNLKLPVIKSSCWSLLNAFYQGPINKYPGDTLYPHWVPAEIMEHVSCCFLNFQIAMHLNI